ncbi:gmc oxidoreductase [Moniliophthora roreri]|nr:gmc oxidoreductase [Moniliophthora roreri]
MSSLIRACCARYIASALVVKAWSGMYARFVRPVIYSPSPHWKRVVKRINCLLASVNGYDWFSPNDSDRY